MCIVCMSNFQLRNIEDFNRFPLFFLVDINIIIFVKEYIINDFEVVLQTPVDVRWDRLYYKLFGRYEDLKFPFD